MEEFIDTVIIDNGSSTIKSCLSSDDAPRTMFPSLIGEPCGYPSIFENIHKDFYIGEEAQAKRLILNLKHPIEEGRIQNWEDMEKIWHHCYFNELKVNPEEHPAFLIEPCQNSKYDREKITQIMFEVFKVPSFSLFNPFSPSLFASGRTTGIVLDSGLDITHAVPILEGRVLPKSIKTAPLAGQHLTDYMMKLLSSELYPLFSTASEKESARDIKEKSVI